MAEYAVTVRNLGKAYHFGGAGRHELLRERLERLARAPLEFFLGNARSTPAKPPQEYVRDEIWALRNVNFDVKPGEVVGLIGANGAGKSTLLKILSRVVSPTMGEARIRGRVGSLLEVGAGFHPELTGHENIFLNGALIGMSRAEIRAKYDEIAEFSGVKDFLQTPVKYYSSGMYIRLAFSIASTLDTDILFLDEVLSVGDAEFQSRSRKRMRDILRSGRTIFLVTHDSSAVRSYCTRAIWLKNGEIVEDGAVERTVADYMDNVLVGEEISLGSRNWPDARTAPSGEQARLTAVRITRDGMVAPSISSDEEFCIEIEYEAILENTRLNASFTIFDSNDYAIFSSNNFRGACEDRDGTNGKAHVQGRYLARCWIPARFLNTGEFTLYVNVIHDFVQVAEADRCVRFMVTDGPSMREEYKGTWPHPLRPRLPWGTYSVDR